MAANDTDFIFPPRVIPELRDLRGKPWQELIDRINNLLSDSPERVALVLMVVRLCGCTSCQADSFKAMRGCTLCATQTIKRFRGSDIELINQLETAQHDVIIYSKKRTKKESNY